MQEDYIEIMIQSLIKKEEILDALIDLNKRQEQDINDPTLKADDFREVVSKKADLIEAINKLDEGFQTVYDGVKSELEQNQSSHEQEIVTMQDLIRRITDKSNEILAQERRNKNLAESKFEGVRKQVKEVRGSQKALGEYYRNMMKLNFVDPQFMDKKK